MSHYGLDNYSAAPECFTTRSVGPGPVLAFQSCFANLYCSGLVVIWFWCAVCDFYLFFLSTFNVCLKLRKKTSSLFPSFTVSSAGLSSGWNASDGIDFFEMYASPSLIGVLFLIFIWLALRTFLFLQLGGISPFPHCFLVGNHDKITSLLFKRK